MRLPLRCREAVQLGEIQGTVGLALAPTAFGHDRQRCSADGPRFCTTQRALPATATWSASRRCEALLGIEDVLDRRSVALVARVSPRSAPARRRRGRSPRYTHHLSIRPASL